MKHSLTILLLLLPLISFTQGTFQKLISSPVTGLGGVALAEAPDGGFVIAGISGQVIKLNSMGEQEWSHRVDSSGVFDVAVLPDGDVLLSIATKDDAQAMVSIDPAGQLNWVENTGRDIFLNGRIASASSGILTVSRIEALEKPFYIQQRDFDGNLQWFLKMEVESDALSGYAVAGTADNSWLVAAHGVSGTYLFKISDGGIPGQARYIPGLRITDIGEFPNGDIFVSGSLFDSNDVVILRFGSSGTILWQKRLQSLIQNVGNATLGGNGEVLVRTNQGNGLAGLVKIGPNGELLWARGYPSGNYGLSRPIFTSDGDVAMLVPKPNQATLAETVFIKADAEGHVTGCEVPDICPEYVDIDLEINSVEYTSELVLFFGNIDVALLPLPLEITPFCETVQLPLPDFEIADTLCAGEHATPVPVMNLGASAWEWDFGAGAVPAVSGEQFPENILFTEAGLHIVQQKVLFTGCRDSFVQVVHVLPAPIPKLGPDTLICEDASYLLDGTLPGMVNYLWENGSDLPVREIDQNGTYTLTATDEQCMGVDSVEVRFFSQTWPDATLALPDDTLACAEAPLIMDGTVAGATAYQWSTGEDTSAIVISEPGSYFITAYFEHCPLTANFNVGFESCAAKIYLPSAFSPNNDGINDRLNPYAKNAFLENMKVFDRWGGIVYDSGETVIGWDGRSHGKLASPGVYVVLVQYMDGSDGKQKWLAAGVNLLR